MFGSRKLESICGRVDEKMIILPICTVNVLVELYTALPLV